MKPSGTLKPSGKPMRAHRKSPRPGNKAMTVAERAFVTLIKRKGCGCCIQRGFEFDDTAAEPVAVEAHHHLHAGLRIGHDTTEGICLWHHRGRCYVTDEAGATRDHAWHRLHLGPNLLDEAEQFERAFGSDAERLRLQVERLGGGA